MAHESDLSVMCCKSCGGSICEIRCYKEEIGDGFFKKILPYVCGSIFMTLCPFDEKPARFLAKLLRMRTKRMRRTVKSANKCVQKWMKVNIKLEKCVLPPSGDFPLYVIYQMTRYLFSLKNGAITLHMNEHTGDYDYHPFDVKTLMCVNIIHILTHLCAYGVPIVQLSGCAMKDEEFAILMKLLSEETHPVPVGFFMNYQFNSWQIKLLIETTQRYPHVASFFEEPSTRKWLKHTRTRMGENKPHQKVRSSFVVLRETSQKMNGKKFNYISDALLSVEGFPEAVLGIVYEYI